MCGKLVSCSKLEIWGMGVLVDITDYLDVPARDEALAKLNVLESFEQLKKNGRLREASDLLEDSCRDPHIFHGYYKRLFMVWRQLNKEDLATYNYKDVIDRVIKTINFNDEMLTEMSKHWSSINKKKMTKSYFAKSYSHIKITDGKALLKAATALQDKKSIKIADKLIKSFEK